MKKAVVLLALLPVLIALPALTSAGAATPEVSSQSVQVAKKSPKRRAAERACRKQFRKQGRRLGRGASKKERRAFKRCVGRKLKKKQTGTGGDGDGAGVTTPGGSTGGGGNDSLDPGEY